MTSIHVLAIDVGAGSTKAAVYDMAGIARSRSRVTYALQVPKPGLAEQDPETWWAAVVQASKAALEDLPTGRSVDAIAVSSTNALVLLDQTGRPVRPAIMQLDERGHTEADSLRRRLGATIARVTGSRVARTGYWLPALAWLHEHEPESLAATDAVLYPSGFIVQRLTGVPTIDTTRAATTLLFDHRRQAWSDVLAREAGLRASQLPVVAEPRETVGTLVASAAASLGLIAGTPVVAGAMDSVASALGLGLLRAGDASVMLGTVARIGLLSQARSSAPTILSCPYPQDGLWWSMGALWDAGRWLQWTVDTFHDGEWMALGSPGRPNGADPLIVIPPGRGRDGAFIGVRAIHSRRELAEGALLGVLSELTEVMQKVATIGAQPTTRVAVCGPAAAIAAPALAGLLGTAVEVPPDPEVETRGDAILAACAVGAFHDLADAIVAMVPRPTIRQPLGDWHAYAERAASLRRAYRAGTGSEPGRATSPTAISDMAARSSTPSSWAHRALRLARPQPDTAGVPNYAHRVSTLVSKEKP